MDAGWFAMKRGIHEHPLFHHRPDRLFVWSWMLATAAWKDTRQNANGHVITVKRGQLSTSYRQIEKATGVGVKTIRNLVDDLKEEHAIDTDTGTGRLLITICNYEKYQSSSESSGTHPGTERAQEGHTKEQVNNTSVTYVTGEADLAKVLFTAGVKVLTDAGKRPDHARSMIGKWRKTHGDEAVIAAVGRAQREGAIDPVSFIEGIFRHKSATQKWRSGNDGLGFFGLGVKEV